MRLRTSALCVSCLAISLLAPVTGSAATPPRHDSALTPIESQVEAFLLAHREFALEESDVVRLIRTLTHDARREGDRTATDAGAVGPVSDRRIGETLRALGFRPDHKAASADPRSALTAPDSRSRRHGAKSFSRVARPSAQSQVSSTPAAGAEVATKGPGSGSISGTITEEGSGTPLPGIEVDIFDVSGNYVTYTMTIGDGTYATSSVLDTGTYYALTYAATDYVDERYDNLPCAFGYCEPASGTGIPVVTGVEKGNIDFALAKGGGIAGTVTDADGGAPIEGIQVELYDSTGDGLFSAYTTGDGTYDFGFVLPAGTYYARTQNSDDYVDELFDNHLCPFYNCDTTAGSKIEVASGATSGGIDFALDKGGSISGTITEAGSATPLQNVRVYIYDSGGSFVGNSSSIGDGTWESDTSLPTGDYYARTDDSYGHVDELYNDLPCPFDCDVTTGASIAVTLGLPTTGRDFELEIGGTVAGTVTDADGGAGIEDVEVDVYFNGEYIDDYVQTAADGTYLAPKGLPAGTYTVQARTYNAAGRFLGELFDNKPCAFDCDQSTGTDVVVALGTTTSGIDFVLDQGGSIAGTVTEAVGGAPIDNLELSIYDAAGDYLTYASTASDGTYETEEGLPAATYYARTDNRDGHLDEIFDSQPCGLGCDPTTGSGIVVSLGAKAGGVDFSLALGGRITGTITAAESALPVYDLFVRVYDANGESLGSGGSAADGTYLSRKGLPTGVYYLVAEADNGFRSRLYTTLACPFDDCSPLAGTAVAVTSPSTTSGIDFVLERQPFAGDGFESGGFGVWTDGSGAAPLCAHSMCTEGIGLDPGCDPCVADVLLASPSCASAWDYYPCVTDTWQVCGVGSCDWYFD